MVAKCAITGSLKPVFLAVFYLQVLQYINGLGSLRAFLKVWEHAEMKNIPAVWKQSRHSPGVRETCSEYLEMH